MLRALGCLLVFALVLTACDLSDEPSIDLPSETPPLLPLAVGNAWPVTYTWDAVDGYGSDRTVLDTLRVVSTVEIDGETWHEIRSSSPGTDTQLEGYFTNRLDGVYRYSNRFVPSGGEPLLVYKFPVEAGDTYVSPTYASPGIDVEVIGGAYPVTWDFGFYRTVIYEFTPPSEINGFTVAEGAGIHRSALIPGIGFADMRTGWLSTAGSEDKNTLTDLAESSYKLTSLPTLYDEDTPSAVPASARAHARQGRDLPASSLRDLKGTVIPVGATASLP
ncbi:MAG: hypothetical protein AAF809_13710 [Bacteroidota bacterium]